MSLALILLGTFASEDLTCLTVGLLIHGGQVDPALGIAACFLGIFVGDLGLWLLGRFVGRGLLPGGRLRHYLSVERLDKLDRWFGQHGARAVFAARFMPGLRLPFYLAAGILGRSTGTFLFWMFLAALLWTPLLVGAAALFGQAVTGPLTSFFGSGWIVLVLGGTTLYLLLKLVMLLSTSVGRGKFVAKISRLWRWEFWPTWLFYLPLLPWLAWLSLRYRHPLIWTAANPGIPQGGVLGESKFAILEQLPGAWIVPSRLIAPGLLAGRLEVVRQALANEGWTFPLILKPDASQRGAGVKRVGDMGEVEQYLGDQPAAVIVQPYYPGPYEAGIFYYRWPGKERGRIFSITDKRFPVLMGNGISTLEELIWQHPRYRMQADVFLRRHAARRDRVLAAGEQLPLGLAGNHCQGTLFRDGSPLWTRELEKTVDEIARHFPGFFIGRFDVRYRSVEAFMAGQDMAIVELNGVTSESTNLYDPSWSLWRAYGTLFRQWELLYRIGHANRLRGYHPATLGEIFRLVRDQRTTHCINPLAD